MSGPTRLLQGPVRPCSRWVNSGEPCDHKGCLSHLSHPCEGCNRIAGRGDYDPEIRTFSNPELYTTPEPKLKPNPS